MEENLPTLTGGEGGGNKIENCTKLEKMGSRDFVNQNLFKCTNAESVRSGEHPNKEKTFIYLAKGKRGEKRAASVYGCVMERKPLG